MLRPELMAEPRSLERLLAAVGAAAGLKDPHIAALQSVERIGTQIYIAYEFVEGKSLQSLLQSSRRLDMPAAFLVLKGSAAALRHAHGQGAIHGDLKPANIMLTRSGEVKVMDFAVAHENRLPPPYTAPEQEQGKVTAAADLYALSIIFYEMLTGERPVKGPNFLAQKREAFLAPPSTIVPGLPLGLDSFFKVALAPERSKRFATAQDLASAAESAA